MSATAAIGAGEILRAHTAGIRHGLKLKKYEEDLPQGPVFHVTSASRCTALLRGRSSVLDEARPWLDIEAMHEQRDKTGLVARRVHRRQMAADCLTENGAKVGD